jgi:hypothetical protein
MGRKAKTNPVLTAADQVNAENGHPTDQAGTRVPGTIPCWARGIKDVKPLAAGMEIICPDVPASKPIAIHMMETASGIATGSGGVFACGYVAVKSQVSVVAPFDHPNFCPSCLKVRSDGKRPHLSPVMVWR